MPFDKAFISDGYPLFPLNNPVTSPASDTARLPAPLLVQFAPAAGGYLLATRLTGWLYDTAAARHGDSHECIGPDCFRVAFLLLSAVAAISSVACSVATARSRVAYEMIAAQLSKVDSAAQAHTDVEDC
eukprot:GHUV01019934.1.p2 GENE.GHUV01019934.1~~GHUV01019934.1.p2  ORF type:complete len:129 (+),score=36.51 GHUV01019934.1:1262-1648(+)